MTDRLDGPTTARIPRRAVTALVTAVGVVACVTWLVRNAPPEQPAPRPVPAPDPAHATTDGSTLAVRFADARHAFALTGACRRGPAVTCSYELRSSSDGGRTWQTRPAPLIPVAAEAGFSADLTTLGPRSVLIVDRGRRWFSTDAGRSWRAVRLSSGRTVPEVPPGATLVGSCPPGFAATAGCDRPVAALDPRTGQRSGLASQPRLLAASATDRATTARDGSLWISGIQAGKPAIAVTRDRGRSWRTVPLAAPTTPLIGVSVLTHDGRTVYAFVRARAPAGVTVKNSLAAIWRATDGGASWHRVRPRFPGAQPDSALGLALLPGGRLLVTTEEFDRANLRYSDDGGRQFVRSPGPAPSLGWIEEVDGRYTASGTHGDFFTSTDGIRWTPIPSYRRG